jgi:hypothetical protein
MQNDLEFAENLARNLHQNLEQIRLRKLTHHLRTMGYAGGLPATPTIPIPRPNQTHQPNPASAAKNT